MLLLLRHYCRMKKLQLCVFHVDHAMRDSSEADRIWVGDLAAAMGLNFYWHRATADDYGNNTGPRSEAWAREFRYQRMYQMLAESGAEVVATGHTADDQAETIVMRLLRGCSMQGFAGIRERACRKKDLPGLRLWRPLLHLRRRDLESYLQLCGQSWREDETNAGDHYLRNRVRHNVMPLLNKYGKNFAEHLALLAQDVGQAQNLFFRKARAYLRRLKNTNELEVKSGLPIAVRREIIRQWLIELGLGKALSRAMITRIDDLWLTNASGRAVNYRKFCFVKAKNLIIYRITERD